MMKIKTAFTPILVLLILQLLLSACTAEPFPAEPIPVDPTPAELNPAESVTATPTPDPCTGWSCTLEGFVYLDSAAPGNKISGMPVDFKQVSNCSPTKGEYQGATDEDGRFSFEVFLHDTDSFVFEVNVEGYQPALVKLGGFDCLFCACDPVEIILQPVE